MSERDKRISDQLVRLVQIIFGLVIAQSLVLYRDLVTHPWSEGNWIATLALATVYVTTILSWFDWHLTMEYSPYDVNPKGGHRFAEQCRLFSDLAIVSVYAYLLFTVEFLIGTPATDQAWRFLLGFPLVFAGYVASGVLRMASHGARASNLRPIVTWLVAYVLLLCAYVLVSEAWRDDLQSSFRVFNAGAISAALALMLAYRVRRRVLRRQRDRRKDAGLNVGIDIDGVIGDQIEALRPHVVARQGLDLRYEEVTSWNHPIGDSNIVQEIAVASQYPDYTLNMPLHAGARAALEQLDRDHRIVLLTARPAETAEWTRAWLRDNRLPFDDLISAKEKGKSALATDLLIDDYVDNLVDYLAKTSGVGVLVNRPWNQERTELRPWLDTDRLHVVTSLSEAVPIVGSVKQQHESRLTNTPFEAVDAAPSAGNE